MCYSVRIKTSLKELGREFGAQINLDEFARLFEMRVRQPELKIPFGLDRYFLLSQDSAESRLVKYISAFYAEEKMRGQQSLRAVEAERKEWRAKKPSATVAKKIGVLERRILKLRDKANFNFDRISPLDDRIFPAYFAPVIVVKGGEKWLQPMRYRVQNTDGSEVPSQYNVFNARRDALTQAKTWRILFGKNHLIFPFLRFYEWVSHAGKKEEIFFAPEGRSLMWAAGLYSPPKGEARSSPKGEARSSPKGVEGAGSVFGSFAMITDDPPPEVAAAGHDRCPIFLKNEQLEAWLKPSNSTPNELLLLLRSIEKTFYLHGLAA